MLGLHVVRRGGGYIPRKKCVHCPTESQVLAGHPCSSGAISSHLPCWLKLMISASRIQGFRRNTYLMISLSLMIRLISWIIDALTHTVCLLSATCAPLISLYVIFSITHSLCESENHCDSSNCSRTGRRHYDHHQGRGSRILFSIRLATAQNNIE